MSAEQRRFERKTLNVLFNARDAQGVGQLMFESADLSPGGTFLKSDLLLEQGEALSVEFAVLEGRVIRAQARVAWVRRFPQAREVAGMGVEFVSMPEADREALMLFLGRD
ncbi:MAG: PilZ domain-containing protein [Myxococcales bacterium]|nr:PilZ domain-containing protein [Myxococcales bacterium]MDP3505476.1 PilZ domain-containing protein [Myxococcales bacterium]